jgi:hypothetical protein
LETALTGYIEKIAIEEAEFRKKTALKLNIHIRSDRNYVIQCGLDTIAGQCLVHALAYIPQTDFSSPLTIAVEPGDTEQVLFARVYKGSTAYRFDRNEDIDWESLARFVVDRFTSDDVAAANNTIASECKRLGWGASEGRTFISKIFPGKTSRSQLSDSELVTLANEMKNVKA